MKIIHEVGKTPHEERKHIVSEETEEEEEEEEEGNCKRGADGSESKIVKRAKTSLDDEEAQEEDDGNLFEEDIDNEMLPPSNEEGQGRQAEEEAPENTGKQEGNRSSTEANSGKAIEERRAVRVGGCHKVETETGEQTAK